MVRIWNKHKQTNIHFKRKIFVGLSGGVDSAVSAALLKEAGAEVTGVFIKGWYPPGMSCTWAEDRRDAMRVAASLRIPFLTLDASKEYKKEVIDYLIAEYRIGRTPNPDSMCNKEIKFGVFYRYALEQGADAIATGHYRSGEKNQTYFLWAVPAEILEKTFFPVGHMNKDKVRKLAKAYGLPVAEKKDSQGICFLGTISVKDFLKHELGEDNPALLYTLGERTALPNGPWYVVGKDVDKKEIKVSRIRSSSTREVRFNRSNWFMDTDRATEAQYRYQGVRVKGGIKENRFIADVSFPETPSPGQSIVFYRGDELVGGGIITE
jgi:tRNA-uridine 2-sulfurtransferase